MYLNPLTGTISTQSARLWCTYALASKAHHWIWENPWTGWKHPASWFHEGYGWEAIEVGARIDRRIYLPLVPLSHVELILVRTSPLQLPFSTFVDPISRDFYVFSWVFPFAFDYKPVCCYHSRIPFLCLLSLRFELDSFCIAQCITKGPTCSQIVNRSILKRLLWCPGTIPICWSFLRKDWESRLRKLQWTSMSCPVMPRP